MVKKKRVPIKKKITKKKVSKRVTRSNEDKTEAAIKRKAQQQAGALEHYKKASSALRDISPIKFDNIDWDRRNDCRPVDGASLRLALKTYMPKVFIDDWSTDQIEATDTVSDVTNSGGKYALAMPRGGGKTAIGQGTLVISNAFGLHRYLYYIGDEKESATDSLESVKTEWLINDLLFQDFPEVARGIRKTEGRHHLATGQVYNSLPTFIKWGSDEIRLPCIPLHPEIVELFHNNNAEQDLLHFDDTQITNEDGEVVGELHNLWVPKSTGVLIKTKGIGGGIRGAIYKHPITGELLRPDFIFLDDVQSDKVAESPTRIAKTIKHIDGAVKGLGGPGGVISTVMLCTVTENDDVSDTYIDRDKKPEYQGKRGAMVLSWPNGITDELISDETEEGKHWLTYLELRKSSLKERGDISLATEYYSEFKDIMDKGFVVSWESRFINDPKAKGNVELSAQQHAINLRAENPLTFACEYQNKPREEVNTDLVIVKREAVLARISDHSPRVIPSFVEKAVAYIDVQDESLWFMVLCADMDFTAHIPHYGTYPNYYDRSMYFTKAQTLKWKGLTRAYLTLNKDHPRGKEVTREAKLYTCIKHLTTQLLTQKYVRYDGAEVQIERVGIDARWNTKVIKRLIYNMGEPRVIPCMGVGIGARKKPMSDYSDTDGTFKGNHLLIPPPVLEIDNEARFMSRHVSIDTNYWKSFVWNRFSTPLGEKASITIYRDIGERHEMLADHITKSEAPTTVEANGRRLEEWDEVPGRDNEYFDCISNCYALLSLGGVSVSAGLLGEEAVEDREGIDSAPSLLSLWRKQNNGR